MAFLPTKLAAALIVASLATLVTAQSSYTVDPVVDVGYAQYRGVPNTTFGVTTFFGLRYAQAPTGNLRWRRPREIEYSNSYDPATVVDATVQGPICMYTDPCNID